MAPDVCIRGGTVVMPHGLCAVDVAIEDGTIVAIEASCARGKIEIDATGLHVFPGLIDPHVHFNEPGRTDWEGFASGSLALAAGGGTCFFDMPLNSDPPLLDADAFQAKHAAARANSLTDFALWGGLTPGNLDELKHLVECGVIGFKAFMCDSGIPEFGRVDEAALRQGMRLAAASNRLVAVHAESETTTRRLTSELIEKGFCDWDSFLASRPVEAEREAVEIALALSAETGCRLHIVHVSHPDVVAVIQQARDHAGLDVTCETCPHYLTFSSGVLPQVGAIAKCAPPLRDADAVEGLWATLRQGSIDWVASDHSPCPPTMKQTDDVFAAWGGIAGVQSTLQVLLSHEPPLGLPEVSALTSGQAANRFDLKNKGKIELGRDADLVLVALDARFTLLREQLHDRHRLSPYVGLPFRGEVRRTLVRGRSVFVDGTGVGPPSGRLVTPEGIGDR
ncbi:MAG: allantoinase AllB [Planctomycetota bacterium]